ncbi:MAG: hypothetical protein K9J25_05940 [Bacteroidales bacterium]|nr:hypothetical protein [Bacteroidales bacterium]
MIKRITISIIFFAAAITATAQEADSIPGNLYFNSAERLLLTDGNLKIGGYGGVHYNQSINKDTRYNGKLDVHRFIMMLGYQFNNRTQFITELEFEHVKEVYVEQAFIQYKLNNYANIRGGLLLTPMGLTNEYHEPTNFNGVERPLLDKYIVPSTWREIGIGVSGIILPVSVKYQAYLMNGFKSFDNQARIGGSSGLRGGRQKAAESFISSPNLSGRIEYFGLRRLNLGLSAYYGKTQSNLYDGIRKDDEVAMAIADSSVVNISMLGADARYSYQGLQVKAQLYYTKLSNTNQYNQFTADKDGGDLGSSMAGFYIDLGYNVLRQAETTMQLIPFIRYSSYDTHKSVAGDLQRNPEYHNTVITTGLSLFLEKGAVIKTDIQLVKNGSHDKYMATLNAGFGIMF